MSKQKQKSVNEKIKIRFHPLAEQFDIDDIELEFADAVLADPYRNATATYMMLFPNTESTKAARTRAYELIHKPNVAAYMKWATETNHSPTLVSREFVLLRLRHVAERAMGVVPVLDKDGQPNGEYKSDFSAANKALELLGKQLGMFKSDQVLSVKHDRPSVKITIQSEEDEEQKDD